MFERFTDRARRVLVLAQDEATALDHNFLGTEHILLGLLTEGEGVGAKALLQLGVRHEDLRDRVVATIGRGEPGSVTGAPPFTPRAKKVLELSLREALELGHNYIGTEHQLLALMREGEGVAAQVLLATGLTADGVRRKVIELLVGFGSVPPGTAPAPAGSTPAVNLLGTRVKAAAAGEPVGSHHYLLGMLEDRNSLAAKVLESFGVTREAVVSRIAELGTAGTTDEPPKPPKPPAGPSIELEPGVKLTIDDPALARDARSWLDGGLSPEEVVARLRAGRRPPEPGEGAGAT